MSNPIVSFDEQAIKSDIRELVRQTVEDTINALLDEEADLLVNAERYERTADREAYRAGHYTRNFTTTSGNIEVAMPKLKGAKFVTAVIERYKRREVSVEEAIVEMYLAGVSTRRVEDVSEILWGGYRNIDEQGADLMFQLVSTRYEQRSTIITTNVGIGG